MMDREILMLTGLFLVADHHRSGAMPTVASIKKAHDAVMLIAKEEHARRDEIDTMIKGWEAADDAKRKAKWEAEQAQREADFMKIGKDVLKAAAQPVEPVK